MYYTEVVILSDLRYPLKSENVPLGVHVPQVGNSWLRAWRKVVVHVVYWSVSPCFSSFSRSNELPCKSNTLNHLNPSMDFVSPSVCSSPFAVIPMLEDLGCIYMSLTKRRWNESREDCYTYGADLFVASTPEQFFSLKNHFYANNLRSRFWMLVVGALQMCDIVHNRRWQVIQ